MQLLPLWELPLTAISALPLLGAALITTFVYNKLKRQTRILADRCFQKIGLTAPASPPQLPPPANR